MQDELLGDRDDPMLVDAFLKVVVRTSEEEYNDWRESGSRIEPVAVATHDHPHA